MKSFFIYRQMQNPLEEQKIIVVNVISAPFLHLNKMPEKHEAVKDRKVQIGEVLEKKVFFPRKMLQKRFQRGYFQIVYCVGVEVMTQNMADAPRSTKKNKIIKKKNQNDTSPYSPRRH